MKMTKLSDAYNYCKKHDSTMTYLCGWLIASRVSDNSQHRLTQELNLSVTDAELNDPEHLQIVIDNAIEEFRDDGYDEFKKLILCISYDHGTTKFYLEQDDLDQIFIATPDVQTVTSEEILQAAELYSLQDTFCCSWIPFKYKPTESETGWMDFVRGKYSIVDFLDNAMDDDGYIVFTDPEALSRALDDDCNGAGKAVMLSDDTALQKLFFWLYSEEYADAG